jgi:hypothetical protein
MTRFVAYKQGVGDPELRLAGCGRIRMIIGGDSVEELMGSPSSVSKGPRQVEGVESYVYQEPIQKVPV